MKSDSKKKKQTEKQKEKTQKIQAKLDLQVSQPRQERLKKVGYEWHDFSDPATATVGVRPETDEHGLITNVRVAGRPRPKHGGSQGQHTTAYCVTREAIISASIGRTEDKARVGVALLFKTLLKYPAFKAGVPEKMEKVKKTVMALSGPTSPESKALSLGELSTLYLEVRDSLPGASLNTGVDSGTDNASAKNTHGKAEAKSLGKLRALERQALMKDKFNKDDITEAVTQLLKLYDADSEVAAGLEAEEIASQRATFLMSVAQAFPGLFSTTRVRVNLTLALSRDRLSKGDVVKAYKTAIGEAVDDVTETAEALCDGNGAKDKPRPQPPAFAATLNANEEIEFDGRPDSVKDGSSMGDHTASMLLMQTAATGAVTGRTKGVTKGEVAANLTKAMALFHPDKYAFLKHESIPKSGSSTFAPYIERLTALETAHKAVKTLVDRLEKNKGDKASPAEIAEAGELYLAMVDNRPTAVNYAGVANNHNEQNVKKELEGIRGDLRNHDADSILKTLLKLVDSAAIIGNDDRYRQKGLDVAFRTQAIDEILHFLDNAYPDLCKQVMAEMKNIPAVREKVWEIVKAYSEDAGKNHVYVDDEKMGEPEIKEEKAFEKRSMKREAQQLSKNSMTVDGKRKRKTLRDSYADWEDDEDEEQDSDNEEEEDDEDAYIDESDDEDLKRAIKKKKKIKGQ